MNVTPTGVNYAFRSPADFHRTLAAAGGTAITPAGGFWEYPEDIQTYGLSAATELAGWSVAAELSYQKNVPVQINGNDLLQSALLGAGPYAADGLAAVQPGEGAELPGYDRFDKTQFQVNTLKTFSNIFGAQSLLLVGEVGLQSNDVPDYEKAGTSAMGAPSSTATASCPEPRRRARIRSPTDARTTATSPTFPGAIASAHASTTTDSRAAR